MLLKSERSSEEAIYAELIEKFQTYLQEVLDVSLVMHEWEDDKKLPIHLTTAFSLRKANLFGGLVVIAFDRGYGWTVSGLRKQLGMIAKVAEVPVLFVSDAIRSFERIQMIKDKIAFVVPGRQLYLPPLGLDLRERYTHPKPQPGRLSASSQAVVILALLQPNMHVFNPSALAERLEYEPMTMTRVFNELESNRLAQTEHSGRSRFLHFNFEGRDLWMKAKPLLASPVIKRYWFIESPDLTKMGLKAGLSALAELSDLAHPSLPVLAVPSARWWPGPIATSKYSFPQPRDGSTEVEFWAYPPRHFSQGECVDHFSLYLSLRETKDERVEKALDQLEEGMW